MRATRKQEAIVNAGVRWAELDRRVRALLLKGSLARTISFANKTGLPLRLYARARASGATTGAYTLTTLAAPAG